MSMNTYTYIIDYTSNTSVTPVPTAAAEEKN